MTSSDLTHLLGRFFRTSAGSFSWLFRRNSIRITHQKEPVLHVAVAGLQVLSVAFRLLEHAESVLRKGRVPMDGHWESRLSARMTFQLVFLLSQSGPCGQQMNPVQVPHVIRVPAVATHLVQALLPEALSRGSVPTELPTFAPGDFRNSFRSPSPFLRRDV